MSLPPPPSYCRHRDFELLQTIPNVNRAKHPEEAHKMLALMHPLSVRRNLSESPAESKTKVTISLNQINCRRSVSLGYRSREYLSYQSFSESLRLLCNKNPWRVRMVPIISERVLGKLLIKYPSQPHLSEEIQLRRVQYSFRAGSIRSQYRSYLMQRADRGEPDCQLTCAGVPMCSLQPGRLCDGSGTVCSQDKQSGSLDKLTETRLNTQSEPRSNLYHERFRPSVNDEGWADPGWEQQGGRTTSHSSPTSSHPRGLPLSLLQHLLSTLLLRGKAGNRPDFDLNAVVELLPSHVPHALVGSCNGPVLQGKQTVRALPRPARPHASSPWGAPARAVVVLPITKPYTLAGADSLHCQGLPRHVAMGNSESQLLKGDGKFTGAALP